MFSNHSHITIFGMTGSGKSVLCRQLQEYFPNVFIFDTLYEYNENDGYIVRSFQEFQHIVLNTKNDLALSQKIIIQFEVESRSDDTFNQYLKILYHRGNCTVVIEEVQNFASVHKIPLYLEQIALTGRHKKVNFITTTQRIAVIHKTLISQAHHIFSGYSDSPNDIKTLKEYGFNTDHLTKLDKYQFIWKNNREYYLIDNQLNIFS